MPAPGGYASTTTERTVRILIGVGLLWIALGIVRLTFGGYVFGGIGIALGVAMVLRAVIARSRGQVI